MVPFSVRSGFKSRNGPQRVALNQTEYEHYVDFTLLAAPESAPESSAALRAIGEVQTQTKEH